MATVGKETLAHSSRATINLDDDPVPFPKFCVRVEWDDQVEEILLYTSTYLAAIVGDWF